MAGAGPAERWDHLLGALQEVRADFLCEAGAARDEAQKAKAEIGMLQQAGYKLQQAFDSLQEELRQAAGDAAYYKVLFEDAKQNAASGDGGERSILHEQLQAARAEAGRWRELAENRGQELAVLRSRLARQQGAAEDPVAGIQDPAALRPLQVASDAKVQPRRRMKDGSTQYFDISSPKEPVREQEKAAGGEKMKPRQLQMAPSSGPPKTARRERAVPVSVAHNQPKGTSPTAVGTATAATRPSSRNPLSASTVAR